MSALLVGAAFIAIALVALALLRPHLALLTLVALDVSNINGVIAENIGISPYKPQLALAVLVLLVMGRRRQFRFQWSPVVLGLLILYAGFCLSLVSAADPVTSQALLVSRARDFFYFIVVFALILSTDRLRAVGQAAVIVLAGLAALTVIHEFVLDNNGDLFGLSRVPLVQEGGAATPRHAGTSSDVNFWARLLILFTPLSLALWASSRQRWSRIFWLGCAASLGLGVYLTQSRGGFIAVFVAVVAWLALAGGRYRRSLLFGPVVLAVLVPVSGIGSRLGTLTAITAGSTANADPSVVTRKRLQLDALHMFQDSPLTGHGIGSYGTLFPRYDRVADYYQPVDIVAAAHNFYLEQAADGGVFLLLTWAIFIGSILFAALRASASATLVNDVQTRFLALGVIGGICGWLLASVFLHLSDFRALLVLAAIAAALDVQSRRPQLILAPVPIRRLTARSPVALLSVVLLASGLGAVGALTDRTPDFTEVTDLAVVPSTAAIDPSVSYQQDVVSRELIVPTLAAVVNSSITADDLMREIGAPPDRSVTFDAIQSRLGGAVTITVSGPDAQTVHRLQTAAVAASKARVATLRSSYQLKGEASAPTQNLSGRRWVTTLCILVFFIASLALIASRHKTSGRRRDGLQDAREAMAPTIV